MRWLPPLLALVCGCSVIWPLDELPDLQIAPEAGSPDGPGDASTTDINTNKDPDAPGSDAPVSDGAVNDAPVSDAPGSDATQTCLAAQCPLNTWCQWSNPVAPKAIHDLDGADLDSLWAVGESSEVLKFDATTCAWQVEHNVPTTTSAPVFRGIWAGGPTNIHVVGDAAEAWWWNGKQWKNNTATCNGPSALAQDLKAIGKAGNTVFAVGSKASVLRYDATGGCWDPQATGVDVGTTFYAISGGPNALYVGGAGNLIQADPAPLTFTAHNCGLDPTKQIYGLWSTGVLKGDASYSIVAVGYNSGSALPGAWWLTQTASTMCAKTTANQTPRWNDVDGLGTNDWWAVGDSGTMYWHVGAPPPQLTSDNFTAVWVRKVNNDRWVVATTDKGQVFARRY